MESSLASVMLIAIVKASNKHGSIVHKPRYEGKQVLTILRMNIFCFRDHVDRKPVERLESMTC